MAGVEFGTTSYTAGSNCNGSGASGVGTTIAPSPASTCIFYDIQTSNNSQGCSAGSPNCYTDSGSYGILSTSTSSAHPAYPAAEGYDLATGIGSLNIANLVNDWQSAAAGGISYTPTVTRHRDRRFLHLWPALGHHLFGGRLRRGKFSDGIGDLLRLANDLDHRHGCAYGERRLLQPARPARSPLRRLTRRRPRWRLGATRSRERT